jgi:ABC-type uncharacterized transport system substrate-binding protein
MMRSRLSLFFAAAFVLLLAALLIAFNHHKPRILILQTYAEDGPWETAVDSGIRRELQKSLQPLTTRWHYMSFSGQQGRINWEAAGQNSRQVIDTWQPDVLIAIGEEAQQYVGRHYRGAGDMALVYGIGEDPDSFGYSGAGNVTGVRETLPLAQIVEVLRYVNGGRALRIRALGVDDATGAAERQQVQAFAWAPHQLAGVRLAADYAGWQQAVREAAADADLLLVLSSGGLPRAGGAPGEVPIPELAQWTEQASRVPVIAVRDSYVAGGGALAVVPAPEALGEQLVRQALAVLERRRRGKPLPPPQATVDFQISLRPERLAQRDIALPSIYLQAARASHTLYLPRAEAVRPGRSP